MLTFSEKEFAVVGYSMHLNSRAVATPLHHQLWRVRRCRPRCLLPSSDIRVYYTFLYIAHVPPNLEDRGTANIMATATPALDRLSPAQAQPAGTYPEFPPCCQQIPKSQHQRNLSYSDIF